MSWFDEVKPYFLVARVYGLAPYTFAKGVPSHSRAYRILMIIVLVTISSEASFRVYQDVTNKWALRRKILMALRALVTSTVFITEGISSVCCLDDVKSLMDHIKQYDRAFGIDFATKSVVIGAWSRLAVPALYLPFLCILRSTELEFHPLVCGYNVIRGAGWCAMVLKFLGILSSLERRFEHLCNIITKAGAPCIVDEVDGNHRPLRLEDVGRLNGHLISAARKFNSMHNMVLLMWICELSFFITLKMYTFLNDNSSEFYDKSWHTFFYLMPDVTILIYLFVVCHNTAAAANKIGWVALSPKSCVLRGRFVFERDESFLIGQSFIFQKLHITAGYGLLHVELPQLGTIIGAMTTVLVILCG